MKKKLLAGILALALCSTNMPPQTIFAGEFTSGTPEVVSEEETPEIFTNEEQEAAGETDEELSVFSSEEIPEFNDTPDEAMAATENAQNGVNSPANMVWGGKLVEHSASARIPANNFFFIRSPLLSLYMIFCVLTLLFSFSEFDT